MQTIKTVSTPMSNEAIDERARWIIIYSSRPKERDLLRWKEVRILSPKIVMSMSVSVSWSCRYK